MPAATGIIDTMIGFPHRDLREAYKPLTQRTLDRESREQLEMPVGFMFKDVPDGRVEVGDDPVELTLREMDRWGIERGMIALDEPGDAGHRALERHPKRFIGSANIDPSLGMEAVRRIRRDHAEFGLRAICYFPAFPQIAIDDKCMYPIYATCVELGIPAFVCAGVPGPRLKMDVQHVERIDTVMFDFPELVLVTRHGCEPWEKLAVKLMLKWPGLHYSTSAFSPRYYPKAIVDYANSRGADKILYAGYFPMGLSLERIMTELAQVPFRDAVWPKFLRENALRVLGLAEQREEVK